MKGAKKIALTLVINLPWILWALQVPEIAPLKGSRGPKARIETVEDSFEQEFWGRAVLVRLRNQFLYSVYDEIRARNVIQGPNGMLFEESYFKSALGWDVLDSTEIQAKYDLFSSWRERSGVPTTVVVVPGKPIVVPKAEWPVQYAREEEVERNANYNRFKPFFSADTAIRFIDFVENFEQNPEAIYVPYPKNSVHWSEAANTLMTQAVVEHLDGIQLTLLDTLSVQPYGTEEDIEESMNLLFNLEDRESIKISAVWDTAAVRPKVLIIGDSYAWGLLRRGLLNHASVGSEFWYYNRRVHGPWVRDQGAHLRKYYQWETQEDMIEDMAGFDQVIWVMVDSNLKKFPFEVEYFKKKNN